MDDDGHITDIPREISEHVSEWKRFGRFLRRSDGRLNQIETEHPKCYDRVYTIMTEFCYPEPINNSWSFWKKKLLEYPEGDKIIREIEITVPEVINEAPTYLKSTFEIIFKQDNVKLFEDLVHLHSIYVSEYEKSYKEYLLDFAKEYDASKLRTLICNQYTDKQLVAVTSIISHLFRDFSAYMLIKHGAQEYITPPLLCETPHHVAAAHNSDKVDYCTDVNGFYIEHEAPLHTPSYFGSRNVSVTVREHINIQDKCTTDIDSLD